MHDMSPEELKIVIGQLVEQMTALQSRVDVLEGSHQQIPHGDLVLIGAAVAAYFGHKAKVKAVRYGQQTKWAAATRGRVHDRTVPHSR
ncbi:MAG: hypothetical protein ACTHWA_05550 [Arachnia sp.]